MLLAPVVLISLINLSNLVASLISRDSSSLPTPITTFSVAIINGKIAILYNLYELTNQLIYLYEDRNEYGAVILRDYIIKEYDLNSQITAISLADINNSPTGRHT